MNRCSSVLTTLLLLIIVAQTAYSYGRFQWFIEENSPPPDDPGGYIYFNYYHADIFTGAFYSRDWIRIAGSAGYPQFYGPVYTSREDVIWAGGTVPNYGIFHAGLLLQFPDYNGLSLPTAASIREMCGIGLSIMSGPAYIDSLGSWEEIATTLRIRDSQLRIYQWLHDYSDPEGDTIYYEDRYDYGQYLALPSPQQGIVSVWGKLLLEGRLQGQATILASDTVWIIDDVYYADVAFDGVDWIGDPAEDEKGMPPPGSLNRLAIISEKNVIVAFTTENGGYNGGQELPDCEAVEGVADRQHILITAAIMALDNVFEVDFWHNSCTQSAGDNPYGLPQEHPCNTGIYDERGTIYLWGSIFQKRVGFIRRSPIGPYGNRRIGYDKRYRYDANFLESFPPCFPQLWDTLNVPEDFSTIQNAIDIAHFDELIVVDPGYYAENLMIDDKRITLTSRYLIDEDDTRIEETVIAGVSAGSVINIQNGIYPFSRISGFTLTQGGGHLDDSLQATVGGAVSCINSAPLLEDLLIEGNSADYGGGVYLADSPWYARLRKLTFTDNSASAGGALYCAEHGRAMLDSCILWNNSPAEIYTELDDQIIVTCSDVQGGWFGWSNLDVDPLFCDPEWNNYRLQPDSPCRTDACGVIGYTDVGCDGEHVGADLTACPEEITLSQNHPNPFNPSTTIEYSLTMPGEVMLSVYNINGQLVDVIHDGLMASGRHIVIWTASGLSSGVYFVELRAGADRDVMKVGYVK
jgi:predicted outer membrane repeat protein